MLKVLTGSQQNCNLVQCLVLNVFSAYEIRQENEHPCKEDLLSV